jgi:hypothetical protein
VVGNPQVVPPAVPPKPVSKPLAAPSLPLNQQSPTVPPPPPAFVRQVEAITEQNAVHQGSPQQVQVRQTYGERDPHSAYNVDETRIPTYQETSVSLRINNKALPDPVALSRYPFTADDGSVPAYEQSEAIPVVAQSVYSINDEEYETQRNAELSRYYDEDGLAQPFAGAFGTEEQYTNNYQSYPALHEEIEIPPCVNLDEYWAKNPETGLLTVRVTDAVRKEPVAGATVQVTRKCSDKTYRFATAVTDANGYASKISLPAPAKQISFAPSNDDLPYAVYDILVSLDSDYQLFRNATIFPNTESVQQVYIGKNRVVDEGSLNS